MLKKKLPQVMFALQNPCWDNEHIGDKGVEAV